MKASAIQIQSVIRKQHVADSRFSAATYLVCREGKMKFLNILCPKAANNTISRLALRGAYQTRRNIKADWFVLLTVQARANV